MTRRCRCIDCTARYHLHVVAAIGAVVGMLAVSLLVIAMTVAW